MSLIAQLNEASGIPIDDLKKVMSKDPRVKQIFSKTLNLEDIQNRVEFIQTAKFFLLNNRHVIDFVESRDYIKGLDKSTLKALRELKPVQITQKDIDRLLEFTSVLFREHAHVERSGMSPHLRKELLDWVNANGRYFNLSSSAQRELQSLPGVRPTRPILLYRGLLFNSSDLKERKRYDGQLEIGKGLKFLRSIREGSRVVDLEWDRPSSWTTSKEVAMKFAKFGPATSNFDATLQWLNRSSQKNEIDGDLGFIISTLAQPEDVLIDVRRMVTTAHIKHGDEGEVILKPGTYTARVSTKYTKAGEVSPISDRAKNTDIIEKAKAFNGTWLENVDWDKFKTGGWSFVEIQRMMSNKDIDSFKAISDVKVKAEILEQYAKLKDFYDEELSSVPPEELDDLAIDSKIAGVANWLKELSKYMNGSTRHQDFKSEKNMRGDAKVKQLSPKQIRDTEYGTIHGNLKGAFVPGRFTDRSAGMAIDSLSKVFGNGTVDSHRKGKDEQKKIIDSILDGFFKALNREKPADREEAIKEFKTTILAAERNAGMISSLSSKKRNLDDAIAGKVD